MQAPFRSKVDGFAPATENVNLRIVRPPGWGKRRGRRALMIDTFAQFKNNHFTEMCCGNEVGSYSRRIDSCITQLKARGPSRTCNESKEEERSLR